MNHTAPSHPYLSWAVHRDLASLFANWRAYVKELGPDAFLLIILLEAIRLESFRYGTFNYRDIERALDISPATLRRWLHTLKEEGFLTTEPAPDTNRADAHFSIHLRSPSRAVSRRPLTRKRTPQRATSRHALTRERTRRAPSNRPIERKR